MSQSIKHNVQYSLEAHVLDLHILHMPYLPVAGHRIDKWNKVLELSLT
jgi:hypothetical protein